MKTTSWDAIVTSSPIDKQAAIARDGKGIGASPQATLSNTFEAPPPVVEILTGQRFGKLVVFGLCVPTDSNRRIIWVCRCDCGRYTKVSAKALPKQAEIGRAHCGECDYWTGVRNGTVSAPKDRPAIKEAAKERRAAEAAERDARMHPEFQRLMDDCGLDRDSFLKSAGEFLRIQHQGAPASPLPDQAPASGGCESKTA